MRTEPAPVFFVAPEGERHVGGTALQEWRAGFKLTSKRVKVFRHEYGAFSFGVTAKQQGVNNVFRREFRRLTQEPGKPLLQNSQSLGRASGEEKGIAVGRLLIESGASLGQFNDKMAVVAAKAYPTDERAASTGGCGQSFSRRRKCQGRPEFGQFLRSFVDFLQGRRLAVAQYRDHLCDLGNARSCLHVASNWLETPRIDTGRHL